VLYAFTANRFVRQLFRQVSAAGRPVAALIGTAVAAVGVSATA